MSQITLKPRISEKAYALSTLANTYVFDVPLTANKPEVKKTIEERFNVTVIKITGMRQKGKKARSLRLGDRSGRRLSGKRNDLKKMYVTLADKDSIKIFEEPEVDKKQAKKDAKAAKAYKKDNK